MTASGVPEVVEGCQVTLHFSIRLEDGSIVDTTHGKPPACLVVGDGQLPAPFENLIKGLKAGQTQTFELRAKDSFGVHNPKNVRAFDKTLFPEVAHFTPGLVIEFSGPGQYTVPGVVQTVFEHTVKVDFNHPLAGRDIQFCVEILELDWPQTPIKIQ